MKPTVIDATNLILGRLASNVAKRALHGESFIIINCENSIVTGKKKSVLQRYKEKYDIGNPLKGPFFPKMPDRVVRRTIRNMLPFKQYRGKEAFKKISCYVGIPEEFKSTKKETIKEANINKTQNLNYITLKEISKYLGN
mgnify:CR=1 FL=1